MEVTRTLKGRPLVQMYCATIVTLCVWSGTSCVMVKGDQMDVEQPESPTSARERQLRIFEYKVGYDFHDKALLALAVTHASVGEDNNRRLQFLGRPVLEVLVREHLYLYGDKSTAPSSEDLSVGQMDFIQKRLLNTSQILEDSRSIHLDKVLRVGKHYKGSLVAALEGAYKALFGAIFLDGSSFTACRHVYSRIRQWTKPEPGPAEAWQ